MRHERLYDAGYLLLWAAFGFFLGMALPQLAVGIGLVCGCLARISWWYASEQWPFKDTGTC